MSERTSISAYFSSFVSLAGHGAQPAEEEGQRDRDDAGVVQREPVEVDAGRSIDRLLPVAGSSGLPDTTGEKMISTTQVISPPYMLHSAPRVLNRFQNSE